MTGVFRQRIRIHPRPWMPHSVTSGDVALPATDDFDRSDEALGASPMSDGNHTWVTWISAGLKIVSNVCAPDGSFDGAICDNMPDTAEVAVQAKFTTLANAMIVVARADGSGNGYGVRWHTVDGLEIVKFTAEVRSTLASLTGTVNANDTVKITVSGTTITGYINGVSQGSTTDASYTTGKAGLYFGNGTGRADDWNAAVFVPSLDKVATDTGTGTEVAAVEAAIEETDSGAGDDAPALTAEIPVADVGAGADEGAVEAEIPVAEDGAGADIGEVEATIEVAETGAGSDDATAAVPVEETDTGAGTDVGEITEEGKQAADTGAGTDALALEVLAALTDAGSGLDEVAVEAVVVVSETGVGVDLAEVFTPVEAADAGAGTDVAELTLIGAFAVDAGAGSDAAEVIAALLLSDAGVGVDVAALTAALTVAESGAGTDVAVATVITTSVSLATVRTRRGLLALVWTREV